MSLRRKLLAFLHNRKKTAEYTELAYLESTGTQWIDTGVAFQAIKAVIEVCFNSEKATRQAMGFSSNNTTYFAKTSGGVFELGGGVTLDDSNAYQWQEVIFEHNGVAGVNNGSVGKITVGDKSISRSGTPNRPTTNFCLFNIPGYGTTLVCYCKISSAKFYNANDELIADLIPVLDKDFTPCMYDKVSGTYLYNVGTGEFNWKLPNQLEYLESDGNQYLNLGIIPNDKIGVKVKFYVNSASGKNYVVGSRGNGVGRFYLYSTESSVYVKYGYGAFYTTNITPVVGTPVEASLNYLNDRKYIYNGTEVNSNLPQTDFSDNTYDMYLFSSNFANVFYDDAILNGRIYYCQITQGDKVAMYLIPVFDEDLTPCMYDLVSKQYLRNQGTGAFKGYFADGSRLVSYLESDGNQWIDTGVVGTENISIETGFEFTTTDVQYLFGSSVTYNTNTFCLSLNPSSGKLYRAFIGATTSTLGNTGEVFSTKMSVNKAYFSTTQIRLDDEVYDITTTVPFTTPTSMYLFAKSNNGKADLFGKVKVKFFKIYDKGVLVLDLLPVLDSSNTACMYDVVTEKLFVNQGSGSFTYE